MKGVRAILGLLFWAILFAPVCARADTAQASGNGGDSMRLVLSAMSESGALNADQSMLLQSYFADEQQQIQLFEKYGLLDDHGLQDMIHQILDVTETRVDGVFTPEQRAVWKRWENLFANRRPVFQRSYPLPKKP